MKKIALGLVLAVSLCGCGESEEVKIVKGGRLSDCAGGTMDDITKGFMKSPSWESGKSEEGTEFVNVTGEISYMDKPVKATVQFYLSQNKKNFNFHALEFNGVPQNQLIAGELLQKMCDNTPSSSGNPEQAAPSNNEVKKHLSSALTAMDDFKMGLALYYVENGHFPTGAAVLNGATEGGSQSNVKVSATKGSVWEAVSLEIGKPLSLPNEVLYLDYNSPAPSKTFSLTMTLGNIKSGTIDGNAVTVSPIAGATAPTGMSTSSAGTSTPSGSFSGDAAKISWKYSCGANIDAAVQKYFHCEAGAAGR